MSIRTTIYIKNSIVLYDCLDVNKLLETNDSDKSSYGILYKLPDVDGLFWRSGSNEDINLSLSITNNTTEIENINNNLNEKLSTDGGNITGDLSIDKSIYLNENNNDPVNISSKGSLHISDSSKNLVYKYNNISYPIGGKNHTIYGSHNMIISSTIYSNDEITLLWGSWWKQLKWQVNDIDTYGDQYGVSTSYINSTLNSPVYNSDIVLNLSNGTEYFFSNNGARMIAFDALNSMGRFVYTLYNESENSNSKLYIITVIYTSVNKYMKYKIEIF